MFIWTLGDVVGLGLLCLFGLLLGVVKLMDMWDSRKRRK